MLLKRINEIVDSTSGVSGIYLFIADEKNKELYEKFNYSCFDAKFFYIFFSTSKVLSTGKA